MTHKIPDQTKELWCPLLESGTLMQAQRKLYDPENGGFCCLGVLAKAKGAVIEAEYVEPTEEGDEAHYADATVYVDGTDVNDNELLEAEWASKQGLSTEHQNLLSSLNDGMQALVPADSPLLEVYRKHAKSETACPVGVNRVDGFKFEYASRDFAEIAKVIREDL